MLVRPDEEEKIGSLYVPPTVKGKDKKTGVVVQIGDNFDFEVELGDHILFDKQDINTTEDGLVSIPHRSVHYVWKE